MKTPHGEGATLLDEGVALLMESFQLGRQQLADQQVTFLRDQAKLMDAGHVEMLSGPEALRWAADVLEKRKPCFAVELVR